MDEKNSKPLEFDGTCVEEAIQKALDFFSVKREDLVVKIVSEEKKGLFGMEGEKPAKITAALKEK